MHWVGTYSCSMGSSLSRVQFRSLEFLNSSHMSLLVQIFNLLLVVILLAKLDSLKMWKIPLLHRRQCRCQMQGSCRHQACWWRTRCCGTFWWLLCWLQSPANNSTWYNGVGPIAILVTCFSPSFDMIFLAFFSPLLCLALLTSSSGSPAAAAILKWGLIFWRKNGTLL